MRNILCDVPRSRVKEVGNILKAIFAQEDRDACRRKAAEIVDKLRETKLKAAAKVLGKRDRGCTYLHVFSARALASNTEQQQYRADQPGNTPQDECCRLLSGWEQCAHAGLCKTSLRFSFQLGCKEILEHGTALCNGTGSKGSPGGLLLTRQL